MFGNYKIQVTDDDCTDEKVETQSRMCKERYMNWKKCANNQGYKNCKSNFLEEYYLCVDKLNAMRIYLEYRV